MGKFHPAFFSSQKEFDGYVHCINKIRVGDKVSCYMSYDGFLFSRKTDRCSPPFTVISVYRDNPSGANSFLVSMDESIPNKPIGLWSNGDGHPCCWHVCLYGI